VVALLTGFNEKIPVDIGGAVVGDKIPPIADVGAENVDPPKEGTACAVYGNVT
jgi:hypothetical protein